jgi:hypothetical protein
LFFIAIIIYNYYYRASKHILNIYMPITLNHSNIEVQYSTGSNYIIETVKSDLYRKNENIDTVIKDNIQVAQVTPITYIDSGNVYAVESYTYYGAANTADYTRFFTKSTACDILIVAGGGSGGNDRGGGGGGGGIIFSQNITLNGTYTIKVGMGGLGSTSGTTGGSGTRGTNGMNSSISGTGLTTLTAIGGGAGGSCATGVTRDGISGGSGGGASHYNGAGVAGSGTVGQGKNGGIGFEWGAGGGGGGYTTVGTNASSTNAGNGGAGLSNTITGITIIYGSGGGGGSSGNGSGSGIGNQAIGIGGSVGAGNGTIQNVNGYDASVNGCGGGGAGQSNGVTTKGGNGGSGIVIIRYLLGTIPSNNFLTTTPIVSPNIYTAGYFTESTRMFVHNGSSESQSTYNINIPEDTICDMLIVAGGGGGGMDMGGGGGGGGVIELNNVLVTAGTHIIKVGKGGDGAPAAGTNGQAFAHPYRINGKQGSNSSFDNYIAIGGGYGGSSHHPHRLGGQGGNGGSGGGSSGYDPVNNVSKAGTGVQGQGFRGGYGGQNYYSGGGGGAGEVGGGPSTAAGGAYGGRGKISYILGTPYFWAGGGGGSGYSTTGGNGGLGGGGGGAVGTTSGGVGYFNGFAGGGGVINAQTNTPGGNAAEHTGGGGGGGAHYQGNNKGGNGGSGIVIIKLKSLSKTGKIPDEKSLNFSYDPVISFDPGKRAEYQAQLKTGVGGWRIVRFLPATSTSWYPINDNLTGTTQSGISYSYTNYWTVPFGTFDEFVFATLNMNYWLYCTKTTAYASYNNTAANIIKSSFSSTPYTALWYNRGGGNPEDPWISIQNYPTQLVYGENQTSGNTGLIPLDGGMCVLVRDSTASTLVPSTTYTLNFPVPTLTNINTINNVILEGEYDITINNNSSSIVSKTGKHIPKLASPISASTIGINYNVLKPVIDPVGAQWTYNSSNTNVYHMGSVGIGTTSPEYQLDVRGTIYSSLGGYTSSTLTKWSVLSDRRIKENIVKASYDKCLENVKNIELYNFNFKDNCVNTNDRHQLGFIAQEVQQVYPKAVEVSKMIVNLEEKIDDLLTLNITQIDYTLYGAVKSLIEKIENIKVKMEHIKTTYDIK